MHVMGGAICLLVNKDPDGIEEGNAILKGYRELDERNTEMDQKGGSGR